MRVDEPRWWYRAEPTATARLLAPLAGIWGRVAERRYRRGLQAECPVPVICIGNFTVGGTGKTPLALLVGAELARLGKRPAFLSRGYRGRIAGPHWVMPGQDSAADVGDEPLLLARVAPTLVARDRAAGARAIVATGAGHGAIVMDDGLQNGGLRRHLAIAVVDGRRGLGNRLVMPAGPLRAPLEFQLGIADAVLVNVPEGAEARAGQAGDVVDWLKDRFQGPVLIATTRPVGDTAWLEGAAVLAFSGIGAPERFFGLLERLGARIVARRAFPDHHPLSEGEAQALLALAEQHRATLVTTEKDLVRLADEGARAALAAAARVLAIRLDLGDRDGLRLKGLIEASLAPGAGPG